MKTFLISMRYIKAEGPFYGIDYIQDIRNNKRTLRIIRLDNVGDLGANRLMCLSIRGMDKRSWQWKLIYSKL